MKCTRKAEIGMLRIAVTAMIYFSGNNGTGKTKDIDGGVPGVIR
ncbi:hypothetical protein [Chitinophaga rhizophila]|nr:hypothetical protein [Chitinophaga rhizophila]